MHVSTIRTGTQRGEADLQDQTADGFLQSSSTASAGVAISTASNTARIMSFAFDVGDFLGREVVARSPLAFCRPALFQIGEAPGRFNQFLLGLGDFVVG